MLHYYLLSIYSYIHVINTFVKIHAPVNTYDISIYIHAYTCAHIRILHAFFSDYLLAGWNS